MKSGKPISTFRSRFQEKWMGPKLLNVPIWPNFVYKIKKKSELHCKVEADEERQRDHGRVSGEETGQLFEYPANIKRTK